ncbi:MAG TPA: hypothetical protein VEB66_08395 [Opitutaceae bacterium]|nr:hypothetical protein [Opitutaceae bacterium]
MDQFITRLRQHPGVRLGFRQGPPEADIGQQPQFIKTPQGTEARPLKHALVPPDLREFRAQVKSVALFPPPPNSPPKPNGWTIPSTDYWLSDTVNEALVHSDDDGDEYLRRVFVLAHSDRLGVIGVDTHPERLGWIGFYWYQLNLSDGGYPIVAHGFREWLERTLEAGPEKFYWEDDRFTDLGPAIPEDSGYNGPRAR